FLLFVLFLFFLALFVVLPFLLLLFFYVPSPLNQLFCLFFFLVLLLLLFFDSRCVFFCLLFKLFLLLIHQILLLVSFSLSSFSTFYHLNQISTIKAPFFELLDFPFYLLQILFSLGQKFLFLPILVYP